MLAVSSAFVIFCLVSFYDAVAPLAEQRTCDSQVAGSSPGEYDLVPAKWGVCGWESNCGPGGK